MRKTTRKSRKRTHGSVLAPHSKTKAWSTSSLTPSTNSKTWVMIGEGGGEGCGGGGANRGRKRRRRPGVVVMIEDNNFGLWGDDWRREGNGAPLTWGEEEEEKWKKEKKNGNFVIIKWVMDIFVEKRCVLCT